MAEAKYVKKIRTDKGDFQIDYEALANLPKSDPTLKVDGAFADSKAVGDKLDVMNNEFAYSTQTINDRFEDYIPKILTSEFYGDELPDAGNKGRIFFKKVNLDE